MKTISVKNKYTGQRIDKFLSRELFLYARMEISRNINEGNILANGKKIKPSYKLKENDKIKISIPKRKSRLIANSKLKASIFYEDKNIIAINKSAGVKVHPSDFSKKDTLVNFLIAEFPEVENIGDGSIGAKLRPGIVHRLDKDTSGIMVIARNQQTYNRLKELFKNREVIKKYIALVYGRLRNKKGTIKKPIAKSSSYKKQVIAGKKTKTKIRSAITEYKVLREFENFSLVELTPRTGRTHQIRIHLFSLGNPIVGDNKYESKKTEKLSNVSRHLLHAKKLEFNIGKKKYSFQSGIPKDFQDVLQSLD